MSDTPLNESDVIVVATYDGQIVRTIPVPRPVASTPEQLAALNRSMSTAVDSINRTMRSIGKALMPAVEKLADYLATVGRTANDDVRVSGLEARYHVRAGLDPAYATPEALDGLVRSILDRDDESTVGLWLLTPANRCRVAVSAMRGWEAAYGAGRPFMRAQIVGSSSAIEVRCG